MTANFALSEGLDVSSLQRIFKSKGRVEIPEFLGEGQAEALRMHLLQRTDWSHILNAGAKVYEIKRSDFAGLTDQQRIELDEKVTIAGRHHFQYRYEAIRVPDDADARAVSGTLLDEFVMFMSSEAVVRLLSTITGKSDVAFADGQATSYSSGHFLTRHNDDVAGMNRKAAYVFGLSPAWRPEWGGLLMFHGADGNIAESFTPAMGALRLFAVPTVHSVSHVNPLAPEARLSVTGWLRSTSIEADRDYSHSA